MPRQHTSLQQPHRRRFGRRPQRRPPRRYPSGGLLSPAPYLDGFTPPEFRAFYDMLELPRGARRRAYFNALSYWLAAWVALGCGLLGFRFLGPIGVFPGLTMGLLLGARLGLRGGFLRP